MKKYIVILLVCSVALLSGCESKSPLKGKWTATYTVKNGMERPEKKGEIVLYINLEQKIEYAFTSKNFTKKISQKLSSIEKVGEFDIPKTEDEIASELASELTVNGVYNLYGKNINFYADSVTFADGSEMDFQDYQAINPAIGEGEYHEEFSLDGEKMNLGGLEFKRTE